MTDPTLLLLVFALGLGVSVVSGWLGIGGGILMAPALLYVPSLVGVAGPDLRAVTGLTAVQGFAACLAGVGCHGRRGFVDRRLATWMAPAMAASALAGSIASAWMPPGVPILVFAGMAGVAAVLMALAKDDGEAAACLSANPRSGVPGALAVAVAVGSLGGIAGQGGSFLLIPLLLHVLRMPTRVALGTNLAIVAFASLAALAGKAATGQVPAPAAVALATGSVLGGRIGSLVSVRTPACRLRVALAAVVAFAAAKAVIDLRM